jgi:hypothetical protein
VIHRFIGRKTWSRIAAVGLSALAVPLLRAQNTEGSARATTNVVSIGSLADERLRMRQLSGDTTLAGSAFRSVSSLSPRLRPDTGTAPFISWQSAPTDARFTYNDRLPYSLNDGALWAGRGANVSVRTGARAEWGRVRVFILPEVAYSENRFYALPRQDTSLFAAMPASRNMYSSPWHTRVQSIDLPVRFGPLPFWVFDPGQSSVIVDAGRVSVGAATENEWWGPGIRNALLLSNNAPGFPHLFLRTGRPVHTRIGDFEARWLSGWLRESSYFDSSSTNQTRSISMLGLAWQPAGTRALSLGAARVVYAPAAGPGLALADVLNVFANVHQPNAELNNDRPRRDQLLSLFFRWVQPDDRFEFYGEWGRAEFPVSLRDFLVQPNHTQAYTLGLQWMGETLRWDGRLRAQAEVSFLEQSTTFRTRRIGSWYTSNAVPQGYTNRGQVLGAAIGPGSSSQFVGLDFVTPKWQAGMYLNRIRWLEDAHSQLNYVSDASGEHGVCEHDVSFLHGIRAATSTPLGAVQADYSTGWRLNVFFENPGPCYFPRAAFPPRDVHTKSFTLTFTPLSF